MRRISITSPSLKPPHAARKAVPERGTIHEKVAENIQISSSPSRRRGEAAKDLIAKAIRERQETKKKCREFSNLHNFLVSASICSFFINFVNLNETGARCHTFTRRA